MDKPVWPSYDQLHPRDPGHVKKRLEAELDELAHAKLTSIGTRFILAQMAEQQNQHELAAYLKQVAFGGDSAMRIKSLNCLSMNRASRQCYLI